MTEAEIVASLAPSPDEPVATAITPVADTPANVAQAAASVDLDEITQYKLHDFFGEPYRANDEIKRQQLQYVYDKVSQMVESPDYGFVVSKLRDLERIIGISHDERKLYKMYQWLKLDSMRRNIDLQMGAI